MADNAGLPYPRVGVAAVVKDRNNQFVIGRRKGAHGVGKWQFPGGHLEFGEDVFDCARREALEETGLNVRPLGMLAVTNDHFEAEHKHYVTLFVICLRDDDKQEPQNLEPHKCEGWYWKDWESIAALAAKGPDAEDGVFLPIFNMFKQLSSPPWVEVNTK